MTSQHHNINNNEEQDTTRAPPPLGVSVYHLCTIFTDEIKLYSEEVLDIEFADVKIYDIENLRNDKGFIREKGKAAISKEDGKTGAPYVDCLEGVDHVGIATHMLSYSWGNTVKDITSALADFCDHNNLNPKRVYIWICCLCVNQHRVKEKLEQGETVSFHSFGTKFKKRVLGINNLLCFMIPLDAPIYLNRIWCIYEYFIAIMNGCNLNIIMPTSEQRKLVNMIKKRGGANKLFNIFSSTKIEEADATEQSDKDNILALIKKGRGYDFVNAEVNASIREWIFQTLAETAKKEEEQSKDASTDYKLSSFLNNIGLIFSKNGKYDQAIEYDQKSLLIKKKIHGEKHRNLAPIYDNIGVSYNYKGDYDRALKYYFKALAIRKKVHGKHHKQTAISYNYIGLCYNKKKKYKLALKYVLKSLSIKEKVFGNDHEYTAATYLSVGAVYKEKGQNDKAMKYYNKCRVIRENVLGRNHPTTASSYSRIGELYMEKGEYNTAMEYLLKSQIIREKVLGKSHSSTAISYHRMGELYYYMNDIDNALKYVQLALEIREKEFGKNHSDTVETKEWYNKIIIKMK